MSETGRAAADYAALGYRVMPVVAGKKIPATRHGVKDASCVPGQVVAWWSQWPTAEVAIACGERSCGTGFWVMDLDGLDGIISWRTLLRRHNGGRPVRTAVARTGGGGYHYYWRGRVGGNRVRAVPGIDVRAGGGYVLAPPSSHASGDRYEWVDDLRTTPMAQAPWWLTSALFPPPPPPRLPDNYAGSEDSSTSARLDEALPVIPEGGRNRRVFELAAAKVARGVTGDRLAREIEKINATKCHPPLPDREIAAILRSVQRYT